ncbi:hypothetical protein [Pseudoneobacillus sp. C159]
MDHNQPQLEGKLLRYAASALYERMVEVFSQHNIHSYDVHSTVSKQKDGFEVCLRFSTNFAEKMSTRFTEDQVKSPDEDVTEFFNEAAEKCKSQLIVDYYKMIKL